MTGKEESFTPIHALQGILIGIVLFLTVFGIFAVGFPDVISRIPHVAIDNSIPAGPPIPVNRSFTFQNNSLSITIAVNASVYAASKKSPRATFLIGDQKTTFTRYYRAMIDDPTQEPIYTDLLGRFRQIRSERNLSDDEYLELIAAYVQTIPYWHGGNTPPRYPAELLVENVGDCDDKSILLAGLLARENYSVVLFRFGPEKHMAVGVKSDAFPYKSTGFTFLEAMAPAYVGVPSSFITENWLLYSDPLVLPVSTGTRVYRSGEMTAAIDNMSRLAEGKAEELSLRLEEASPGEVNGTEYALVLAQRDRYAAIHRYILDHPLDRQGAYDYLKREMPA